ncbi:unnamed protein product [Strongylus vulgaris]|uniref:Uncharacterized protein n=1 Tax=Strongylus vulgaris TaxID=40348 RepID=A0A3P7KQE8_STRVU|nr:unnamed protein product [Strongylus vulgaris]
MELSDGAASTTPSPPRFPAIQHCLMAVIKRRSVRQDEYIGRTYQQHASRQSSCIVRKFAVPYHFAG